MGIGGDTSMFSSVLTFRKTIFLEIIANVILLPKTPSIDFSAKNVYAIGSEDLPRRSHQQPAHLSKAALNNLVAVAA